LHEGTQGGPAAHERPKRAGQVTPDVGGADDDITRTARLGSSRIFYDLGVLGTRFASLILGVAVVEDIVLWAGLAVATGLARPSVPAREDGGRGMAAHLVATVVYAAAAMQFGPSLLRRAHGARWNFLLQVSPVGYLMLVVFAYAAIAVKLEVTLIFAAFLAGFGLSGRSAGDRPMLRDGLDAIAKVAMGVFVPIFFAMVGYHLEFGAHVPWTLLAGFLIGSTVLRLLSVGVAGRLAGLPAFDTLNLAIAANARGGPGIVLASVAHEAGIINGDFYSVLVISAVVTSQVAGVWLRFVLGRGWPLLSTDVTGVGAVEEER
jgi:Kef-type K+ transport system membrane component KefB